VKIAKNIDEVAMHAQQIIGMQLVTPQTPPQGKLVSKVLVEQNIYYSGTVDVKEIYMSVMVNRATGHNIIMYSPQGGMDIESVAEETPELIFTEEINPTIGLMPFQARKIAFNLGLSGESIKQMTRFVAALYKAFVGADASLFEINPVIRAADERIFAADAKVVIDDNALFRHPDIAEMRDLLEEDTTEVEADAAGLNYVKLNGNVGCMVNGAGLAMATMDIIKMSGGDPANFLDDANVKAILVNIFGGIVRCDRVAAGIVAAYKNIGNIPVPIIVRLQGTNAEEAKTLIDQSGLQVFSAVKLDDAARLVREVVG
jgi:succinyl-CoA synthetase beta subunit